MKMLKLATLVALCAFSTLSFASAKSDFWAAYQACVAATSDPTSPVRRACIQDAWFAYQAALAAPAPARARAATK